MIDNSILLKVYFVEEYLIKFNCKKVTMWWQRIKQAIREQEQNNLVFKNMYFEIIVNLQKSWKIVKRVLYVLPKAYTASYITMLQN